MGVIDTVNLGQSCTCDLKGWGVIGHLGVIWGSLTFWLKFSGSLYPHWCIAWDLYGHNDTWKESHISSANRHSDVSAVIFLIWYFVMSIWRRYDPNILKWDQWSSRDHWPGDCKIRQDSLKKCLFCYDYFVKVLVNIPNEGLNNETDKYLICCVISGLGPMYNFDIKSDHYDLCLYLLLILMVGS